MNCVVICCDTFRADMIGHPVVKTPNLDCLAREGINFTSAFAEGLPTIQARRTSFTGIRSFPWRFEMGSRGLTPCIPGWHRIPDEQTTLAEFLLDNDVVTGFVADTYHMFKPTQNFTRGFASWSFIRGQERDPMRSGPKSAVDPTRHLPDGDYPEHWLQVLTQYLLNMLDRHTEEDYLAEDPSESRNVRDEHAAAVSDLTDFMENTLDKLPYEIRHHGDRRQAPPTIRRMWTRAGE